MLFRYRARNYPQTLTAEEQQRWMVYCRQHLLGEAPGAGVSMAEFATRLANITEPLPTQLRASLKAYAEQLRQQFVIS
jgi:exodeoxyribonuclease-1